MTDPIDELLAGLRDDVPEMSDQAFAAGRARVTAVVAPEPVVVEPKEPAVVPPRKKRLLRSPPRRLIATAAAAVVLAVGVVATQAVWSGDNAPVASAAQQLNAAADKIEPTDPPVRPGQYLYTVSHVWEWRAPTAPDVQLGRFVYLEELVQEKWRPADPAQRCDADFHLTTNHKWLVGDEEQAKAAGLEFAEARVHDKVLCDLGGDWAGGPSLNMMGPMPRDPNQVYAWLRQGDTGAPDDDVRLVMSAAAALSGGLPADARAALYRALALVPGIEVTEQVANIDGHEGVAYGISQEGQRIDVIIDPATGQYIGERLISESGNYRGIRVPAGSVITYTSVSVPTVVDKVGQTG